MVATTKESKEIKETATEAAGREPGMTRVQWIRDTDAGEILFVDLKKAQPPEGLETLESFRRNLEGRPASSVLVLMDVTDAAYNSSVSTRWKAARLASMPLVCGFAIYGLSGMIGVAVRGFSEVLGLMGLRQGEDHKICKNRNEALAWLRQRAHARKQA